MNRLLLFAFTALAYLPGWALSAGQFTNAAPSDVFVLRRFEWIPSFKMPRTVAPMVPRLLPVVSVESIEIAGGKLWSAVRSHGQSNAPGTDGRLWTYQDRTGLFEPVPGQLSDHSVTALHGQTNRLWMGLNGGLASLDLPQNVIHPYGLAQGVFSTNFVGIGQVDTTVFALGRIGLLWGMVPGSTNFIRASTGTPSPDPRSPELWDWFATSGDWMMAVSSNSIATRHYRSPQWLPMRDELANGSPHLTPPRFTSVAGDGEGGFWVGSDAGLHWVNPESSIVENRFWTPSITIPGGLGMTVAPGFAPTAAAYALVRERVMQGIRERMRDRARQARSNARLKHPVNPLLPTSRMPGGVTALHRDGRFLWVATQDGSSPVRSRVLLLHQPGRRWVGWFPVGAPVRCLTTDAQRIWVGCDVTRSPGVAALFAADKLAMITVPPTRWIPDAISKDDLAARLAELSIREQSVLAFFGGEPGTVVKLLAPTGEAASDADAESLFMLTFVNDAVGLHQPDALEHYVSRLRTEHPDSLFTELASAVRSARPAALAPGESAVPPTADNHPEPIANSVTPLPSASAATPSPSDAVTAPSPTPGSPVATILAKWDIGRDGRLNLIEFRLWRGPRSDFKAADLNGDGQLDASEIEGVLGIGPSAAK